MALALGFGLSVPSMGAKWGASERPIRGRVVAPVRTGVVDVPAAEARARRRSPSTEAPRKARRPHRRLPEMPMPEGWTRPFAPDEAPPPVEVETPLAPALALSFPGLGDNNQAIPPDTHGAVGPTKVMTTLNTEVLVQNRAGAITSGPVRLDDFWTGIATAPAFDPRVLYDPDPAYGGRWIWVAVQGADAAASGLLIAASAGAEPVRGPGALFDADPANAVWADYPSVGFNKNWVVVQVNLFERSPGFNFVRSEVYVFKKADLYTGVFAPTVISLDAPACTSGCGGTQVPAATYDFTQEDLYLLQRWNSGAGLLRLYRLSGVAAPTITPLGFPSGPGWADGQPSGLDFAPQPSICGGLRIQTNDSRIQNVVWRNGTLWAAHTVFYPAGPSPTRSAVQWWQVQTDSTVLQRGVIDSGSPSIFHAFPSLAVNKNDDVLVGFSTFSDADFASARYAFRLATDPPGSMQVPSVLKPGEDCYSKVSSGRNRWGDYSATVVDPTDDTTLWTMQEYAETRSGGFDRWGTWWGQLDPTPAVAITDPSVAEGHAGTTGLVFDVTLSVPTSQTVTVAWRTADQTATVADDDYVPVASGIVTFAPGDTAQTLTVAVKGDIKREPIETLKVELTGATNATLPDPLAIGTILDDDPEPQISIGDRQIVEGNPTGTAPADFLLTLSNPSAFTVTVSASTAAGGAQPATPGTDYVTLTGSGVTFAPGQVSAVVTVPVVKDASPEPDETFLVNLSGASGGTILKGTGTGIILDDDSGPPQPGVISLTVVSDGNATSGRNRLQWVNPAATADAVEIRYTSATLPASCTHPANAGDGSGIPGPPYAGPGLVQSFTHAGLALGDVYCYSVFLRYPPSVYSAAANATGRPFDATGRVKWRYFTGATALAPPTVGASGVLLASNDRVVHAATRGPGGGAWPLPWKPVVLGWPAQERSPIVPLAVGPRVFYGTQDGWVQAVDASTGAKIWETQIGAAGGAAPAGVFTAFGGAWDYVLVGTAEANGNRFYALDPGTGAVVDYFPKAGDPHFGGIGAILGMASVDYGRGQVYFASRLGSAPNTLWCLKLGPSSDALTLGWAVAGATVGPIDGSPVVRGDRVYVGNNAGVLWAVDATSGTPLYSYATGDLSVKGFPFPDRRNGDVYVTTSLAGGLGRLHAVTDTGSGLVAKAGWGSPPVGPQMSPPLLWTGSNRIFVGVRLALSGGGLYSINATDGAVNAYDLEPSPLTIGTPSLDIGQSPPILHVGGENGVLYAFEVP
jgi:outer membrane protein assembly factor BamB